MLSITFFSHILISQVKSNATGVLREKKNDIKGTEVGRPLSSLNIGDIRLLIDGDKNYHYMKSETLSLPHLKVEGSGFFETNIAK